jgi:hypothetical protein
VAFAGGTSVQFQQILSAAANLGAPTVIDAGIVVPLANLVAGAMVARPIPELLAGPATIGNGLSGLGSKGLRYYGAQYVSLGIFTRRHRLGPHREGLGRREVLPLRLRVSSKPTRPGA